MKGKTVASVDIDDAGMEEFLLFHFTDGSVLRIRYDYLYEWELAAGQISEPR